MTAAAIPKREGIMLAQTPNPRNLLRASYQGLGQNLLVQPKLNGERCRVEWFHGEPVLLSSYGNEFLLPKITEQLKQIPLKEPWDGELYVHGWSRERIHSTCSASRKTKHQDHDLMELHIFDSQREDVVQNLRLVDTQFINGFADNIKTVDSSVIPFNSWLQKCQDYTSQGYEGIIIRNPAALYQKKRTTDLLKFKPTEQDEYTILGVEEAIDKNGCLKSMVGSFLVSGDDGTVFSVGAGKLSHDKRRHYWFIQETLKGKTLIVKHELLKTEKQIPIAAVAVEVKDVLV